jgi:hypothetical protein
MKNPTNDETGMARSWDRCHARDARRGRPDNTASEAEPHPAVFWPVSGDASLRSVP